MNSLAEHDAQSAHSQCEQLLIGLKKVIVGQELLLERLVVALLAKGHVLVEGPPGVAKTLTLKTLATLLELSFQRIQFTPDLLPSDLVGTRVYNPLTAAFSTEKGPIFSHFVLADEINRAPAKVQSALLEAMQEQQVTIGRETFLLPDPFFVLATQNPLESEGTYPLPDAQLDRFLLNIWVSYPTSREELVILQRSNSQTMLDTSTTQPPVMNLKTLQKLQFWTQQVYVDPALQHHMVDIIEQCRSPQQSELKRMVRHGPSPRGTLAWLKSSQAKALLMGRTYVTADDLFSVVHACLRHRIQLSYEGLASGYTPERYLNSILEQYPLHSRSMPASSEI
jgi:MoxR-like ATPase